MGGRRYCTGYLTVYVSLTLGIILSLCLALIEGVRTNAIKMEAVCIADVAGNSVLAEYHRELFEQYNLFFTDISYGTGYVSPQNVKNRLQYYLDKNVNYEEVERLDYLYKDFLALSFENLQLDGIHFATDGDGRVFQKNAIEAIKDDVGISVAEAVWEWMKEITESEYLFKDMESERDAVYEKIEGYRDMKIPKPDGTYITVDFANPIAGVQSIKAKGILSLCLSDKTVSGSYINPSYYISSRKNNPSAVCTGTYGEQSKLTLFERILLHEYFLRYAGCYSAQKPESLLQYQIEYLISGKDNDYDNLSSVVTYICGIREGVNVAHIYGSEEKLALAKTLGMVLSAALLIPEAAEVFSAGVILAWGFMESVHDVKTLLSGGKIPFWKTNESWHTDLDSIWQGNTDGSTEGNQGQSYEDYLRILLYLADTQEVTYRFMDLCEMDIRLTPGNEAFRIDGCIDYLQVSMDAASKYGYRYEMDRHFYY